MDCGRNSAAENVIYAPGSILADGIAGADSVGLFANDASLKTAGLKGEYFDNADLTGAPKMVRVDAKINFDWNRVAPAASFPSKTFAVRWTGELVPPAAGDYVLSMRGPRPFDGKSR